MNFSEHEIKRWSTNIDCYISSRSKCAIGEQVDNKILDIYLDTIGEILLKIARKVARQDKWYYFRTEEGMPEAWSEKLQCGFCFNVWVGIRYYIQTPILYPKRIYRMPDEFWKILIELAELGKLSLEEDSIFEIPTCMKAEMRRSSKSVLFQLIRRYILFTTQEQDEYDLNDPIEDIGMLEVSWPINTQMEQLLINTYKVFKRFYRLNSMLYRQEYLYNKSIRNKK